MFCWDKVSSSLEKAKNEALFHCLFPYSMLSSWWNWKFSQLSGYFSLSYKKWCIGKVSRILSLLSCQSKVIVIHKYDVISMHNKPSCQSKVLLCIEFVSDILGFALRCMKACKLRKIARWHSHRQIYFNRVSLYREIDTWAKTQIASE